MQQIASSKIWGGGWAFSSQLKRWDLIRKTRMNQKTKDDLFMAHGLGNEPYRKDGRVLIRINAPYKKTATYRLLVNASGGKTPAGAYYEEEFSQLRGCKGKPLTTNRGLRIEGVVNTSCCGMARKWSCGPGTGRSTYTRQWANATSRSRKRNTLSRFM